MTARPLFLVVFVVASLSVTVLALLVYDSHVPGILTGCAGAALSVYLARRVCSWIDGILLAAGLVVALSLLSILLFAIVVASQGGFS